MSEIQAESTRFENSSKVYRSKLDTYNIDTYNITLTTETAKLKRELEKASLDIKTALDDYRNQVAYRVAYSNSSNEGYKNIADTATAGARVYTDIAGAALQSQNSMVQVIES